MTLAVVATGNHYVFDVITGLLVTAAGFAATGRWTMTAARMAPSSGRGAAW